MKKIAIISSVCDQGSVGSLVRQLYEYGKKAGHDVYVFYGRGIKYNDQHLIKVDYTVELYLHKILALLTGLEGRFSNFATTRLLWRLKHLGIKYVVLVNIHGYYLNEKRLFQYFRQNKIKIIYVMPDEYAGLGSCCYCGNCRNFLQGCGNCPDIHKYPNSLFFDQSKCLFEAKKHEYFDQNIVFIGPQSNYDQLLDSELLKDKKKIEADWGIDLTRYHYEINQDMFVKYNIPRDKVIVLTVAKYSTLRKGVAEYFFKAAHVLVGTKYHFVNVGYDGNLSPEEIPGNMTTIPFISDQNELNQLYSLSDLYVLPSVSDTQPLSTLIAFACGTPVTCFYASGLKYISNGDQEIVRYSKDISVASLVESISTFDKKTERIMNKCRLHAEKRFSKDIFNKTVYDEVD